MPSDHLRSPHPSSLASSPSRKPPLSHLMQHAVDQLSQQVRSANNSLDVSLERDWVEGPHEAPLHSKKDDRCSDRPFRPGPDRQGGYDPSQVNHIRPLNARQWGVGQEKRNGPRHRASPFDSHGKHAHVEVWAPSVSTTPQNDTHAPLPPPSPAHQPAVKTDADLPPRPDSSKPVLSPVTLYVSDDEEDSASVMAHASPSSQPSPPAPTLGGHDHHDHHEHPPQSHPQPGTIVQPQEQRGEHLHDDLRHANQEAPSRRPKLGHCRNDSLPGDQARPLPEGWWRPQPHPKTSPSFASRRLLVDLPFPMTVEHVQPALVQHFAKYGTIRCTFYLGNPDRPISKGMVVFTEESSVEKCLRDPRVTEFSYRSQPFVVPTSGTLRIERSALFTDVRHIFIHIDRDLLPPSAEIVARPYVMRNGRSRCYPEILDPAGDRDLVGKDRNSNKQPVIVETIDLRPPKPLLWVILELVVCLAVDIVEARVPVKEKDGWVLSFAGTNDHRGVTREMAKLPGVTVRYARHDDVANRASIKLFDPTGRQSPLDIVEDFLSHRKTSPAPSRAPRSAEIPQVRRSSRGPQETPSPSVASSDTTPVFYDLPAPACYDHPYHPSLRRVFAHVYKHDRAVIRKKVGRKGVYGWVDECAIHISRLVKDTETRDALWQTFSQYGSVVLIEYNTLKITDGLSTARVLYHDRQAALRAIKGQDGQIRNDVAIKVVERMVQASDVQELEMFSTPNQDLIPSEMAAQWSPPASPEAIWLAAPDGYPSSPQNQPYTMSGGQQPIGAQVQPPGPSHQTIHPRAPVLPAALPWPGQFHVYPPQPAPAAFYLHLPGQYGQPPGASGPPSICAQPTAVGHGHPPVRPNQLPLQMPMAAGAPIIHTFGISYHAMPYPVGYPPAVPATPNSSPGDMTLANHPQPAFPVSLPLTPPLETSMAPPPTDSAATSGGLDPKFCKQINGTYTAFFDRAEFERYCQVHNMNMAEMLHPKGPVRLLGPNGQAPDLEPGDA